MKKRLLIILIFLLLLNLFGCGNASNSETLGEDKVLVQTIDRLSKINNYELTTTRVESTTFGDKEAISQTITEQKLIFEPFVNWSRTDSISTRVFEGVQYRSLHETYQVINNNQLDFFIRYSPTEEVLVGKEPVLGEWEKNATSTKEQAELTIDANRSNFDAYLYLLSSNIDTFKPAENNEGLDETILKYDGYLEQTTILKAYQQYIRDIFVKWNLLLDSKNLSFEDLKNEITEGDILELKQGIPKLAYSEEPVPISLWIDKSTFELKKVAIDETLVMQSFMEKEITDVNPDLGEPIVSKALLTYEIKSIDKLKEIPMPN